MSKRWYLVLSLVVVLACVAGLRMRTTVVFDGNSLVAGQGAPRWHGFADETMRSLGWAYRSDRFGVGAQTTAAMLADAESQIDRCYSPGAVLVVWEVTNDLYFGATAEEAVDRLEVYCLARKRAGFRVVVLNVLPRSDADDRFEARRISANQLIASRWTNFADACVDVAAIPELSRPNPEHFADGTHLNHRGAEIAGKAVAGAINR
jgi:lysophospholipase L1-like esterase